MTPEESFAIQQTLELIKLKLQDAFGYIRSDKRGDFVRERKKAIDDEIDKLISFVKVKK